MTPVGFSQNISFHRTVLPTRQLGQVDFAECMRELVDVHFPQAEGIRGVLDNLNAHTPAALYEAFAPDEVPCIRRKLEFHLTLKYDSWLNMAEVEIAILSRQCLKRLSKVSRNWPAAHNTQQATIDWCFDVTLTRTKLAQLYP